MASNNNRDMNLRIRAKDETGPGVRSAQSALQRLAAAQKRTQARRDLYAGAVQSAKDLKQASDDAAAASLRLGERMGAAKRPSKALREEFTASRDAARQAKAAYMDAAAELSRLQGRRGSFAAFDQIARGASAASAPLKSLGADFAALEARQESAARSANATTAALRNQAQAAGRAGGSSKTGALGLRPHELTNLGYQVNDLVTQIASGTSPMQAFAQQGGQIAQIFPQATGAILRFTPAIGLAAAALAPFISSLARSNAEAKRLSDVEAILRRSGEAATYSAPALVRAAEGFEAVGIKGKDATDVLQTFVRDAVDPTYVDAFGRASAGLAKVLGTDVTDAAEKVSSAFTGNADAVLALDAELNFLTDSERKHIELLRESKRDGEARTEAFDAFARKYGDLADNMDGPWANTLANFNAAWVSFVDHVNFIDWSKVKAEINSLIGLIDELTSKLPGARTRTYAATGERLTQLRQERSELVGRAAANRSRGMLAFAGNNDREIAQKDREIQLLEQRQAGLSLVEGISSITAPRPRAADTTRDPPRPANSSTPRPSRRTGKSEAEKQAEARTQFLASLAEENDARAFQLTLLSETERQQEVLTALRQAEQNAQQVGLTLTEAQRQQITDSVTLLYDEGKAREASEIIERARLDLAKQRGEVESRAAYIARMSAADMSGANADQKRVYADILGQNYDIEESKRRQAELEKAVTDQQTIRQEILQQIEAAAATGDETRIAQLQEHLVRVNASLSEAIGKNLAFWSTQSGPEAEAAILKWTGLETAVREAGQRAVVVGTQIDQMLVQGGSNALDQFASSIAEGANAFSALRDSFLQFASDFLRQIAAMIVQQAILNALGGGAGTTGSGAGGGVAKMINGLFRHDGGLVGSGGGWRPVNPAVFAGAMRYHGGGIAGLAPDEVPAILQRNEEVLTEDDPRHRNNGGLAGRGSVTVRNVNVIDPGDMVAQGLETESGERSFFNFIGRNAGAIKAQLG